MCAELFLVIPASAFDCRQDISYCDRRHLTAGQFPAPVAGATAAGIIFSKHNPRVPVSKRIFGPGRAKQAHERPAERSRDVERSAVGADHKRSPLKDSGQVSQSDSTPSIDQIGCKAF
jgi:hypothetical protein